MKTDRIITQQNRGHGNANASVELYSVTKWTINKKQPVRVNYWSRASFGLSKTRPEYKSNRQQTTDESTWHSLLCYAPTKFPLMVLKMAQCLPKYHPPRSLASSESTSSCVFWCSTTMAAKDRNWTASVILKPLKIHPPPRIKTDNEHFFYEKRRAWHGGRVRWLKRCGVPSDLFIHTKTSKIRSFSVELYRFNRR